MVIKTKDFEKIFKQKEVAEFFLQYSDEEVKSAVEVILISSIRFINGRFGKTPKIIELRQTLFEVLGIEELEEIKGGIGKKLSLLKNQVLVLEKSLQDVVNGDNQTGPVRVKSLNIFRKAPSDWRKGDLAIFQPKHLATGLIPSEATKSLKKNCSRNLSSEIYPEWWFGLTPTTTSKTLKKKILHPEEPKKQSQKPIKTSEKAIEANLNTPLNLTHLHPKQKKNPEKFPTSAMRKFYQTEFSRLFD